MTRSKYERLVLDNHPDLVPMYEPTTYSLLLPTTYKPDLVLPNGRHIELKGYLRPRDRRKLLAMQKQHGISTHLVFQNGTKRLYRGSPTTYLEWAEKNGLPAVHSPDGVIPDEWLNEQHD